VLVSVVVVAESFRGRQADQQQGKTLQELHRAARLALKIRDRIWEETGFTISVGVSVNPLLSKIAGGLKKKPSSINILYP